MHSAMDQTSYWMWTRRKLSGRPPLASSSFSDSWEEQAFAEDSAGHLGGCIWPPRSYSCSFCRREFRSAQALGGHMNVHRRDRARLKQSSSPACDENHSHTSPCTQYPVPQVSTTLGYKPNPNPNSAALASPLSASILSAASNHDNSSHHTLVSPSYSPSIIGEKKNESFFDAPRKLPIQLTTGPELKLGLENWKEREVGLRRKRDEDMDGEIVSNKRRRTEPIFPFCSTRPSLGNLQFLQSEVLKPSLNTVEELDLELRLGDPPKVK